ncbi:MAG: efflux RND transporter periplasmic adaptor subunit [Pseudomonadales bacterium]|nr:efflux RND transporter periplasmic adaptor subunit [Pseudomonadales bacterium]
MKTESTRCRFGHGLIVSVLVLTGLARPAEGEEQDRHDAPDTYVTIDERDEQAHIETTVITRRSLEAYVRVPGEVKENAYRSWKVTPRIPAQVVARHARLGDAVAEGDRLVTLSSVAMAEAQGELVTAGLEWQRVQSLGERAVSARRFAEARVAEQQARARALAFGMTEPAIERLVRDGDPADAIGRFDLVANGSGTVLADEFVIGEFVQPGRVLFDISDESHVWVEARADSATLADVSKGADARIHVVGGAWMPGTVVQRLHKQSEKTRTSSIRLEVANPDDRLHAGQFVEVEVAHGSTAPVLSVPAAAITLLDGRPTVFLRAGPGRYAPRAVEIGDQVGDWTIVRSGVVDGDVVVARGVFEVKSLKLKASLGEGHGH